MKLLPEHADAIAAFSGSDVGTRWMEARTAAYPKMYARFRAFVDQARAHGFVASADRTDDEPLLLPPAEFGIPDGNEQPSRAK